MNESSRGLNLPADRLGIWTSSLCVVHCLLTPVLLSYSAVMAHLLPTEEKTHRLLAVGVAALGGIALVQGFRTHGRRRILVLMAAGLAFIFFGAFYGDRLPSHAYEVLVTLTGSTLMITAHRMNHTFCKDCHSCTK
jgi:hypothetical protein